MAITRRTTDASPEGEGRAHMISDEDLLQRFPDTDITHDDKDFYRGWLEHRLLINQCSQCSTWHHPPRPICPECWSFDVQATPVSGFGTIHLLVWLRQGPPAEGVDYRSRPHPVATIELDEQPGLRFTSTLVGVDEGSVSIGDRVELTWIDRLGAPFPVFTPTTSA